jgi:uncharacterized protein YbjT (DUF2867 family)
MNPEPRPLHLVFGASGYIGSHLVPELLRAGLRVRASARNVEVLEGRLWQGVELARADALDPGSLGPALAGVDVAYCARPATSPGPRRRRACAASSTSAD